MNNRKKCRLIVFLSLLQMVLASTVVANAVSNENLAEKQYSRLVDDVKNNRNFTTSEMTAIFQIGGVGLATRHSGSQNEASRPVHFTTYRYSSKNLPHDTWLKELNLTVIDNTDQVIGVQMSAQPSLCIDAASFASKYGLKKIWDSDIKSGVTYTTFLANLPAGRLMIAASPDSLANKLCLEEADVYR